MKKQKFLTLAIVATVVLFTACGGSTGAKSVTLETQADSLNYALGVLNGEGIKASHFQNDSSTESMSIFLKAMDDAFNSQSPNEFYEYGKNIGQMLRQQKKDGLDFDSTIVFKQNLVLQGVFNGLSDFQEGFNPQDAHAYYQQTKQKRIERRIPLPAEMPEVMPTETDSVK